jgi:hypothetical protein
MFQVKWLQEALDELTRIWMQADSSLRQAITAATHTLDQELQTDPYRESESRDDDERLLFAYPLAVQVEVDPVKRIVWVLHVWQFRRRSELL